MFIAMLCLYLEEVSSYLRAYFIDVFWQFAIAVVAYLVTCVLLYHFLNKRNYRACEFPGPANKILLLIAHPDDEVMFFGPLIFSLAKRKNCRIYILCLSIGGSKVRKQELWNCAKILGIPESNVVILMNTNCPDNPSVQWPENVVAENVLSFIETYEIDALVTFDKNGVSGHKNHSSLFYAMASLCIEKRVPLYCKLYLLESVNILRKYTLILDLPISLLTASYWYLITYEERQHIKKAMMAHKSQYVWFRKLYMKFSRYTLLNTFHELTTSDAELDLQLED